MPCPSIDIEVEIMFIVIMSRKEDVHAAEMRRGAQGTSPTHIGLLHNAQKWCMTLAAPLYLPFVDGGSVDFLHCCFSACRFYWIAPDLYKMRIAGNPLSLDFLRVIACHSLSATRGPTVPTSSTIVSNIKSMILIDVRSGFLLADGSKSERTAKNRTTSNFSVSGLLDVVPTILQIPILTE